MLWNNGIEASDEGIHLVFDVLSEAEVCHEVDVLDLVVLGDLDVGTARLELILHHLAKLIHGCRKAQIQHIRDVVLNYPLETA